MGCEQFLGEQAAVPQGSRGAATAWTGWSCPPSSSGCVSSAAQTRRVLQSMHLLCYDSASSVWRWRSGRAGTRAVRRILAVIASTVLMLAGVLMPPLRQLLGTAPLSAYDLLWCLGAAFVPFLLLSAARQLGRP
jgi:P-type Ca2+ transporter type 2C